MPRFYVGVVRPNDFGATVKHLGTHHVATMASLAVGLLVGVASKAQKLSKAKGPSGPAVPINQ